MLITLPDRKRATQTWVTSNAHPHFSGIAKTTRKKKKRVETLLKEIEAMDMAEQVVNIYAVNMVATWGTGEGEDADA